MIDKADTAWLMVSAALVLLMTPALALFYGGMVRQKNVLSTHMHSFFAMGLITVQWVLVGYTLSFGPTQGGWIGGFDHAFLEGVGFAPRAGQSVPHLLFMVYQLMFAIITPALISGAFAERLKFSAFVVFTLAWATLVYNPLAHWVWAPGGWLFKAGVIDLAGGLVIHVSAGTSALVAALYLGARRGYPQSSMHPNNLVMTIMGAGLLWTGWFGFNAGSTVSSGMDTARALTMTQISASSGALTWLIIEALKFRKVTSLGFVSGILAGLVVITPAAGVVHPAGALILGAISSCACFLALRLKSRLGYDDSLDCFGIHGVGSGLGVLLLCFFVRKSWIAVHGGADWSMGAQLLTQCKGLVVTAVFAGAVTWVLCVIIQKFVGFRLNPADEMAGLDHSMHGEHGYGLLNLN